MEVANIKEKVNIALDILYSNDYYLIENNLHEQSISHKLAEYLQILFKEYNIDCEFNRRETTDVKKATLSDNEEHIIKPDIIIHKRGTQRDNLLIIEIKKGIENEVNNDIEKLKSMTGDGYGYKLGLFLELYRDKQNTIERWFEEGKEQ